MRTERLRRRPAVTAAVLAAGALILAWGCGKDPVSPGPVGGGGLRVTLPAGVRADEVTVELWNDNEVPPPTCFGFGVASAAGLPADTILCTRGSYRIRDLLGNVVLAVEDTAWAGRAPAWDGLDGSGRAVARGLYPVEWRCLDSSGDLTFTGNYYLGATEGEDACRWLLWSARPEGSGGRATFAPFPIGFRGYSIAPDTSRVEEAIFGNPYRVRVIGPDGEMFERTVTLADGEYTDVRVSWPSGT